MEIKCQGCGFTIKVPLELGSVECPKCGTLHKFVEPEELMLGYDHSEIATDYSEIWERVFEAQENVEHLEDYALVEEVLHIIEFGLDAPKNLLKVIQMYKGSGKLSDLQRKELEGFYILSYCDKGFKA